MTKTLIKTLRPNVTLHRDEQTGLAWVENGEAGISHTCHPNISGSAAWMKQQGYWHQSDQLLRNRGFVYNLSQLVCSDDLDEVARSHCQCGGVHSFHKT